MSLKENTMRSILFLLVVLAVAGCGGTREVPVTVKVPMTVEVPVTVIVVATATATIAPTAEPTTVPAPAGRFTADEVVAAFQAAGLEAESARPLTRDDYQMAPLVGEGLRFLIPSLCEDCGGRVFAVENVEERDRLAKYYLDLPTISAMLFSWVYVRDNIVVQINGDLPDERAAEYERALAALD
jgi:hypothetical protein